MFEKLINNKLFKSKDLGHGVIMITDITGVSGYLVMGTERALLIDTCCGIGDIRAFVNKICRKPYDVVLTHLHFDHIGGAYLFDEVFITKEDAQYMRSEFEESYPEVQRQLDNKTPFFMHLKVALPNDRTKVTFMKEGDSFPLGGRTLTIIKVPGHTQGSVVLLDEENRLLFTGDAANSRTLLVFDYSAAVGEYYEALKKLKKLEDRYDKFYTAHPPYDVKKTCLDDLLEICREIQEGKNEPVMYEFNKKEYLLAKQYLENTCDRIDGKIGNIVYKKASPV
ncbi:Glyoxylase, beta-lactamase superfamily II [Anaerocolumna jejuensis DSM 15929]|uniref:Glyoxylase, beta-lactamase superfamily II n=1 Tax=Anaerocolumna jejuensis DSM 15929 TaxID=1121322 RepID=A0A1M6W482_9FIRM|nr:MBL fold metallo-hydrolase [Anaerocolumna jejuensis]SHK88275.1 Glyoxylase, beta-lactamase superfamily II [Anaerocolumna jejuensis DSM 15929]